MTKPAAPPSKAERLAAKLRENLHRRKAQARELGAAPVTDPVTDIIPDTAPNIAQDMENAAPAANNIAKPSPTLSKAPPKS